VTNETQESQCWPYDTQREDWPKAIQAPVCQRTAFETATKKETERQDSPDRTAYQQKQNDLVATDKRPLKRTAFRFLGQDHAPTVQYVESTARFAKSDVATSKPLPSKGVRRTLDQAAAAGPGSAPLLPKLQRKGPAPWVRLAGDLNEAAPGIPPR